MIRPKKASAPRTRTKPGSSVYYRELRLNLRKTIANIPIPESAIERPIPSRAPTTINTHRFELTTGIL